MKKILLHLLLIKILLFTSKVLKAYEVDNFTDRNLLKKDSLEILDEKVNKILERAAIESRKELGLQCSFAQLRQEIIRWIRPDPAGQLEFWLEWTNQIDRTKIGIRKSIYQDISVIEGPILNLVGIGRSFLLNGVVVGSDKIGHFFMQGLAYYDSVKSGKPLAEVLQTEHHEDGIWGLKATGVKSYADMATNYQGYRFWSELIHGKNPYFKCDKKIGWVKVRKFTWKEYVNLAWDEAYNCSDFLDSYKPKIEAKLKQMGLTCPLDISKCEELNKLEYAQYYITPKCRIHLN
jgi:hypothetical protein